MAGDIIFRFLGKDGKITIPYAIRESLDFQHGDILSFEELDELSPEQKAAALVHLSMQVAGGQKGSSENA